MASQVTPRPLPPEVGPAPDGKLATTPDPIPLAERRRGNFLLELYRSSVGKKYIMALTGLAGLGYILIHSIGNLKVYLGPTPLNEYGEFLRDFGEPAAPRSFLLWIGRLGLLAALGLHLHAAWSLTRANRRARATSYEQRDYIAATFAARTMRWTGIIVLLYIVFHVADLTFGVGNAEYVKGDVYNNLVTSFSRWPIALVYIAANLALGVHIFHGTWSLFQSLGLNRQRFNPWRRWFAVAFSAVIVVANVSFPIAVLTGVVG